MKQVALEDFMKKKNQKKPRYISTTIAVEKMELFVALSSSLQPLTNVFYN